jgi:N-dimethylarginine dimethylaminohydrolase
MYYPGAFDEASLAKLRNLDKIRFEVSESLANHSVCNSVYIDDTVFLNIDFQDYSPASFERSARGLFLEKGEVRYEEMVAHDAGYAEVLQFLWGLGFGIIPTYTSEYKKSGAGARCLTLFLD